MGITTVTPPKHHYNYFLAIEKDLENLSRYIEFGEDNFGTYSIELARLLQSASSEVDVVLKQICELVVPNSKADKIGEYRPIIKSHIPAIIKEEISINRYCLKFKPWQNWNGRTNPDWWKSYNNVKHTRHKYFQEANLKNTINAVGALLIVTIYYYKLAFSKTDNYELNLRETNYRLAAKLGFVTLHDSFYVESGWALGG